MRGLGVHRPPLSLAHPIYLAGRGYTWETWCDTSSLDFDAAHIERPSKCSNRERYRTTYRFIKLRIWWRI